MAYDNPNQQAVYSWKDHDFGAGSATHELRGPSGRAGILKRISTNVSETFNAVTTQAFVRVGTNADPDAYAELQMGTAADNTVYDSDRSDTDAIINKRIPANQLVEVNFVANTGGTPAGIADVDIYIDWL